jgi:outer membrane receptor protein involved in Fe transport
LCSHILGHDRFDTTGWVPFKGIRTAPCTNLNQRVKEDDTIHKLSVSYKFDEDRMVYATWSRGFRPGGVNRFGGIPPYLADYLTNYEVGWKTTWAGNRLRFNGAVFKQDWEDFQYSFIGTNGLTIIRNANQASINGVEANIAWAATSSLMVSAGAAYTDAKLDQPYCGEVLENGQPVVDCADPPAPKGTRLPITPKLKANASARYQFPLGGFDAHVQGAIVYQDKVRAVLEVAESELVGDQPSYTLVDLSTGITNGTYSFELFVNNVFDRLAEVTRYAECANAVCGYQTYIVPFQPRTVGLKFGQRF